MWICLICNKDCETEICPTCGFDSSQHYEQFPTLTALSVPRDAISTVKTTYEMTLGIPTCPVCGKTPTHYYVRTAALTETVISKNI